MKCVLMCAPDWVYWGGINQGGLFQLELRNYTIAHWLVITLRLWPDTNQGEGQSIFFLKQRILRTHFEAFCNLVSSRMWQRCSKSHSRVHALLIFPPNVDHSQQMLQDWWIVKYLHSAESRGWLVWCLHFFYLMAFLEHHVFFSEILIIILEY